MKVLFDEEADDTTRFLHVSAAILGTVAGGDLILKAAFPTWARRKRAEWLGIAFFLPFNVVIRKKWTTIAAYAGMLMGYESFELVKQVVLKLAGSEDYSLSLLIHHIVCVGMGAVSIKVYKTLSPSDQEVWRRMCDSMIPMTLSNIFLNLRFLYPGLKSDFIFAMSFLICRWWEQGRLYSSFVRERMSTLGVTSPITPQSFQTIFQNVGESSTTRIIFGSWSVLCVLNLIWGTRVLRGSLKTLAAAAN